MVYIILDMARRGRPERTGTGDPLLPSFRDLAQRRRAVLDELVAQRRAAGLSQAEVAIRMGTSQPAVARMEAGEVDVRLSTLERYAAVIGCRLDMGVTRKGRASR